MIIFYTCLFSLFDYPSLSLSLLTLFSFSLSLFIFLSLYLFLFLSLSLSLSLSIYLSIHVSQLSYLSHSAPPTALPHHFLSLPKNCSFSYLLLFSLSVSFFPFISFSSTTHNSTNAKIISINVTKEPSPNMAIRPFLERTYSTTPPYAIYCVQSL
ncbi:unnamed protein product [Acanthosepion pharaonis]|uniref:Uncharacterized protein n=1 Tax=Acanthosepion pharaonis TaxID=158019 RepID=A0A812AKK3_ACAPH|nr:unnamed protein product [Sepia pharaonis]